MLRRARWAMRASRSLQVERGWFRVLGVVVGRARWAKGRLAFPCRLREVGFVFWVWLWAGLGGLKVS